MPPSTARSAFRSRGATRPVASPDAMRLPRSPPDGGTCEDDTADGQNHGHELRKQRRMERETRARRHRSRGARAAYFEYVSTHRSERWRIAKWIALQAMLF